MRLTTTADVLDLLDASFPSAAVGAALELGLFWMIDERPRSALEIGAALGIPSARCVYWLQLLEHAGLLERGPEGFARSAVARTAIVQAFSRETWAFLALRRGSACRSWSISPCRCAKVGRFPQRSKRRDPATSRRCRRTQAGRGASPGCSRSFIVRSPNSWRIGSTRAA